MLHRSFKPAKCNTALRLAVSRIKLLKNKKEAHVKQLKRELAQLLDSGQVQTARIRVEHVVREEKAITAYDLVQTYCELILARMPIIESQKNCPIDLKEAIASVIFATPRCADIPELMDVRKQFTAKYGKEFVSAAVELRPDCGVHRMLVDKLSAKAPDGPTKLKILSTIAAEHNVTWDPDSFGGTDYKPSEDLLNGPKTFEMASKIQMEPFPGPPLPNLDEKGPPNVQIPNKSEEKHDVFNGNNSQNFVSADVSSNNATTSGKFDPEVSYSVSRTEQMEFKNSQVGGRNTFSSGRQNWKIQFKDARAAAQAAAESAEQASMAARAAAELSRYSFESQQSSGHVSKDEVSQNIASSKWQGEHVARAPESYAYHGRDTEKHERIFGKKEEELSGTCEMFYGDTYKGTDAYSQSTSLKSATASADDSKFINNLHKIDRYPQKESFEPKKSDLSGEGRDNNQLGEYAVESVSKLQDSVKSEDITYVDDLRARKQSSQSHSSSFSDDQEDVVKKNNSVDFFGDMRTEKQSSRISSRSHSNTSNDIHEDDTEKNNLGEDLFINEASVFTNTKEMDSNEKSTAVFDDSGSDVDNYKFDVEDYKEQESSSYFSPCSRKLHTDLLANPTVWSPRQNHDEEQGKSISKPHPPSLEQCSSVFSESVTGATVPSNADYLLPVAFDDSDGPSSDSEDVCKSEHVEGTTLDKFPHRENVYSSSEKVQSPSHRSIESSSDDDKNVGSRRKSWLPPFDSYPKEESPVRRQGNKFNSILEQKFDVVELPTGPPVAGYDVDSNDRDNFQSPDLPDTMKDTEFSEGSSLRSGKELNFGMLTGGLRNKGNMHPSYARKSLGNSLSSKEETADTFSNIDRTSFSPTVRMSVGSVARTQENSNLDKRTGMRNVDSDDNSSEEKLSLHAFTRSQKPYNRKSGVELNKKASLRASVTYFDSDNSDTEDNLPKMTSTSNSRLGTGYSRRTKVSSSKSGKTIDSKATVLSEESVAPRAEIRSSSRSSYDTEIQTDRLSATNNSDRMRGREQHKSAGQATSKALPESQRSTRVDNIILSSRKQRSNSPPPLKTEASGEPSSSKEKANHVHPKLPDYDALTAHFRSLRQSD